MIISVLDRVENVGKGEKAGYQHVLLFPQCFHEASFPDISKGVTVWEWCTNKNLRPLPYLKSLQTTIKDLALMDCSFLSIQKEL